MTAAGATGIRIASIGECMIELSATAENPDLRRLGFGGDTLNTATYLARLGVAVDYVTALGDDGYSARMLAGWRREGIGTDLVQRLPGRVPGLYMIELDATGERHFSYWRDRAPAREIFSNAQTPALCRSLLEFDWIYLSGVSLSLYGGEGRDRLFGLLREFRAKGGKVAFDSNFRHQGWPSITEARREFRRQLAVTDLALSSIDDETGLHGVADGAAALDLLHGCGVPMAVIKQGGAGCLVSRGDGATLVPVCKVDRVVDATAAGDSFNAGFLAALLRGDPPETAARFGHISAAIVIGYRGAIAPRDDYIAALGAALKSEA